MGTHHQGSEDEVRALGAYIKLMRAADSVTRRMQTRLDALGLTVTQFGAMEALLHLGPLCQRDLGVKLLKSTGNITMVVDNLEKRGLVRRERGLNDRRYVAVHLTEAGRELIAGIFPGHAKAIADVMAVLSPDEQDQLACLCRKLGISAAG